MRRAWLCSVVTLAAVLACSGPRGRESRGRESRDFERMRQQQRADPFSASTVLPNGVVGQPSPEGTIARQPTVLSSAVLSGLRNGLPVGEIPIVVDSGVLAAGAEHFRISCAVCHGDAGFGGSVVAGSMVERRPPSLHTTTSRGHSAGELYQIVSRGIGRMPAYDWQLAPMDRWAVIAYVRQLEKMPATATPLALSDSVTAAAYRRIDSTAAAKRVRARS